MFKSTGSVCLMAAAALAAALPAAAQTTQANEFKGSFVFTEEGGSGNWANNLAMLGTLNIAANGAVTGWQAVQTVAGVALQDVQGTYVKDGATSGALNLSVIVTDDDGGTSTIQQNYRLMHAAGGETAGVRLTRERTRWLALFPPLPPVAPRELIYLPTELPAAFPPA